MTTVDWIILAVIVVYLLIGLRRGFVMMVVNCIGGILSYLAAAALASRLADTVSSLFLVPPLRRTIANSIMESGGETTSAAQMWEAQSEYLRGLLMKSGLTEEKLAVMDNPADQLATAIAEPVGHAVAYVVLFVLIFLLCTTAIHLIAGFLNLITYLPILSSFNSLLGGLLGAAFALVLCTVVLWTLKLFAPAVYSDYGMLPPSEMHQSVIAGKLVGWNDGVSLFESVGTAE